MGTVAAPHPVIWFRTQTSAAGLDGWKSVDRLWASAWGHVAHFITSGQVNISNTTWVNHLQVVAACKAGRKYKITWQTECGINSSNASNVCRGVLQIDGSDSSSKGAAFWAGEFISANQPTGNLGGFHVYDRTTDANITFSVVYKDLQNDAHIDAREILVEDIGPA